MASPGTYSVNKFVGVATSAAPNRVKVLDLAAEARSIAAANGPTRTARTLARLETLRLTLMTLSSGSKVKEHHTDHELSIQTVSGHVVLHTLSERVDLPAGQIAVLARGVVHDIEARTDSAILVTVCVSLGEAGWKTAASEPSVGGQGP